MERITGKEFNRMTSPCVYTWLDRSGSALYVGFSGAGICRPLGYHHTIGVIRDVSDDDCFEVLYFDSKEEARKTEADLIDTLRPVYNKTNGSGGRLSPHYDRCKFCGSLFMETRKWQKFCGKKCRMKFHAEKAITEHSNG